MSLLLQQNWFVAVRSRLFGLACAFMFLVGAAGQLDSLYAFSTAPSIGIVYAFYTCSYIGSAGTSGRLEAQIISGAPRPAVYIAMWLNVWCCCALIALAMAAGNLASGPGMYATLLGWLLAVLGLMLNAAAYAGIFVLVSMTAAGRGAGRGVLSLIVCTVLFIVLATWGGDLSIELQQPEYDVYYAAEGIGNYEAYEMIDYPEGAVLPDLALIERLPNPDYVPPTERPALDALMRFLPVTQCEYFAQLTYKELDGPELGAVLQTYLFSLLLAAAGCAAGMAVFQRRELS